MLFIVQHTDFFVAKTENISNMRKKELNFIKFTNKQKIRGDSYVNQMPRTSDICVELMRNHVEYTVVF